MSYLGNQSRHTRAILGSLRLYSETARTWVYVKPPDVGDIKYSITPTDHKNWLICDGRSLSRTEYAELFALIGTTYGNDDANTFKLPDCQGRVLGAIGAGTGLTARSAGTLLGAETHTLTVGEMPSHTHGNNSVSGSLGLMSVTGANTASTNLDSSAEADLFVPPTALTINAAGGGGAHNNMQPTAFIGNVFVYAKAETIPIRT